MKTITYRKSNGTVKTYNVIPQETRLAKSKGNRAYMLALDTDTNRVKSFYLDNILSGL